MATQRGLEFLLKISAGLSPDEYTTVAGMSTTRMEINNELVDTTNKDDSRHRSLGDGMGVQTMTLSASGVFKATSVEDDMRTFATNATVFSAQIIFPGLGTYTGEFQISNLGYQGDHNTAMTYDVTLESAGQIFFQP
jgi:TP901-1 family phage major tail protein